MAELRAQTLQPAFLGLDSESAPGAMDDRRCQALENLLPGRPGKLVLRGPVIGSTTLTDYAAKEDLTGIWHFNDTVVVGQRTKSSTAVKEPWTTTFRGTTNAALLAGAASTVDFHNLATETSTTAVAVTNDEIPGPKYCRLGSYVWGISYDSAGGGYIDTANGYQRRTKIVRWDGLLTAAALTPYANAPHGAQDIKAYLNRLFVLGGIHQGTAPYSSNTLYWSDEGGPTADTLAMWQDDVSGRLNSVVIGSENKDDPGVAMAKITNGLVIFNRRSMYVLRGSSPALFSVQQISESVGCVDPRSVVEWEGGVFFMAEDGFYFFDGSTLTSVSANIRALLSSYITTAYGYDGGYIIASRLPNSFIGICTGLSQGLSATPASPICWLLHVPTGAWTQMYMSPTLMTGGDTPVKWLRTNTKTFLFNTRRVINAEFITRPGERGGADEGRDFSGSTYAGIKALWRTKLMRLADSTQAAQLHRILMDYNFKTFDTTDGWFIKVVASDWTTILVPEYQVPRVTAGNSYQHSKDAYGEVTDFYAEIRWEYPGPTNVPNMYPADIYGVTVEYQKTRLRASG